MMIFVQQGKPSVLFFFSWENAIQFVATAAFALIPLVAARLAVTSCCPSVVFKGSSQQLLSVFVSTVSKLVVQFLDLHPSCCLIRHNKQ